VAADGHNEEECRAVCARHSGVAARLDNAEKVVSEAKGDLRWIQRTLILVLLGVAVNVVMSAIARR